ncbi:MAG: hypothetical protein BWK73_34845 [Thiothrix lacustris]|uniref:Uncharacterized protein n=1 Tax=Thiothrix lacustris TaxID=525917 RepID=A0A1Y1QGJ2_9GAMM|nr:MAG: hypothetical protein BWK73_34845 [Thiothrix lacustris]
MALSAALVGLFAWWFQAPWWLLGSYALAAVLIAFTVPLLYRWFGYKKQDEALWLHARNLREHATLMQRLDNARKSLVELQIDGGVKQANILTDILDDYRSVVETRFIGKQFAPITYLNAARSVQEHVVQNLTDMVAVGHSLAGLNRQAAQSNLHQEQQQRITTLLAENDKFFTALNETAVEVANIRSVSQFERLDTLARLVSLAQTASHTGTQS